MNIKNIFLLVVMLLITASNSFAQASFETIDGLRYLLDADTKTATVVASNGKKYSGDIAIPEKVKAENGVEYSVVALGDNAFKECDKLTSIIISSTVTSLGNDCFWGCSSLINIDFPSSVTSLGDYCFYDCSSLTNITIPSSVMWLGSCCFSYCSKLTNITIPSSVTSLGYYCFRNCSSLTSITIPSVTKLRDECFKNCSSLTNITIPSSVTSLGNECFAGCSSLTNTTIPSSVTSLGEKCFDDCSSLTSITIPSSITSLGNECFAGGSSLTNITIPSSVTSLGDNCFDDCSSLTSITIPSSVTSLGFGCFFGCSSLTCITIPSSVTSLGDYCLSCSKLELVIFKGKLPNITLYCGLPTTCILYVPKSYLQDYKDALGRLYQYIYASKDEEGDDNKPIEQCTTPTITYSTGKLNFNSTTPNAEYHYTITDPDMATDTYNQDGTVNLSATYKISVYATADGYKPSEKATATLYWLNANLEDGTSTNINQAKTRGIIATSHDGIITLSGLNNGEEVRFYTADGKQIESTRAIDGVASQAISSTVNSLVIAKIGGQSIKVAVK